MKKFVVVVAVLMVFAASASAEVIGALIRLNADVDDVTLPGAEFAASDAFASSMFAGIVAPRVKEGPASVKFYSSLSLLQLALDKGDIDSIALLEPAAEYLLRHNPAYAIKGYFMGRNATALALGFLEERAELCARVSKVIEEMESEGKIGIFGRDYITGPAAMLGKSPAVKFETFEGAETITIAVTGDLPPIDYVDAGGDASGFNTAMLSEIGRRLRVNVKLLNVDTASRIAALRSGRADGVFWFEVFSGYEGKQEDVPEGIITSTPYFGWNKVVLVGKK